MAKNIDLNLDLEKPTITINGKKYEVNDEKSNILKMQATMQSAAEENKANADSIDEAFEILLGKKATKEINAIGFSFSQYMDIFFAVMSLVEDEDLEVVKERFRKAK